MGSKPAPPTPPGRDLFLDGVRVACLLVVVLWHWGMTLLWWGDDDAPHATNPLPYVPWAWLLTWVLQVVPVFFFVGGAVHVRAWRRWRDSGRRLAPFVARRVFALLIPAVLLLLIWAVLAAVLAYQYGPATAFGVVELVISPLWFVAVYLLLITLLPVWLWLRRFPAVRVLPCFVLLAAVTDVARLGVPAVGWLNLLFVWGLAYLSGCYEEQLAGGSRGLSTGLVVAGVAGLTGLVTVADYPGSMVGVPGDRWSNMAPPSLAVVALLSLQVGLIGLLRPAGQRLTARPAWASVIAGSGRHALNLFLCHSSGMAAYRYLLWLTTGGGLDPVPPDQSWWWGRPLAIIGPLLCSAPLMYAFARWGGPVSETVWRRILGSRSPRVVGEVGASRVATS